MLCLTRRERTSSTDHTRALELEVTWIGIVEGEEEAIGEGKEGGVELESEGRRSWKSRMKESA